MKKIIALLFLFLLFDLFGPILSYAEKFQNSFSADYLTQSRQQPIRKQIPSASIIPSTSVQMPQENTMSGTTTLSETTTAIPETSKTAPPMTLTPTTQAPMPQTTLTPMIQQDLPSAPAMPPTASIGFNKINIKVPDYEKKLREMLQEQEIAKARKKKTLIESIVDEVTHYGFIFIMVFVVALIIYALRKDKRTISGPASEKPVGLQPDEKKDIWSEDF